MYAESREGSGNARGKPWERPWSTEEMRQNAHNWNLAADSGLLKHLQQVSQAVLSRTHATEKALDSFIEDVNTTATEINNINNGFLCLANTQFVENRVYEDDDKESPSSVPVSEKKSKEETEAAMLQRVREALSMSVAVLDTMFEPVELHPSDSEGDTDDITGVKTLLLEPHNPYMNRPLPHLIGSDAFMADDRIGLGDSPSDGEDQAIEDGMAGDFDMSSESGSVVPDSKRRIDTFSSPSSESDYYPEQDEGGQEKTKSRPLDTSHALFGVKSSEHLDESFEGPSLKNSASNRFAAELAAKLGGVAAEDVSSKTRVQNVPPPKRTKTDDNLFGVPHSDEEDDTLFSESSGLFSGRPKLFDDLDEANSSLWGPPADNKNDAVPDMKTTAPTPQLHNFQKSSVDTLFTSVTDDEDDLFSSERSKQITQKVAGEPSQPGNVINKRLLSAAADCGVATSTPQNNHQAGSGPTNYTDERRTLFGSTASDRSADLSTINKSAVSEECAQGYSDVAAEKSSSSVQSKKPVGGVSMFGHASVLQGLKDKLPRRPASTSSSASSDDENAVNYSEPSVPSLSLPASQSASGLLNVAAADNSASAASSGLGATHDSHGAGVSFPSQSTFTPPFSSTRLRHPTEDDGYQTRNPIQASAPIHGDEDVFVNNQQVSTSQGTSKVSNSLFADVDDEEDDLFAPAFKITPSLSKISPSIPTSEAVFDDSSDDLFADLKDNSKQTHESLNSTQSTSKSPTSSSVSSVVRTTGNGNTSPNLQSKRTESFATSRSDLFSTVPPPIKSDIKGKKTVSLFDDSDSGDDELLFSSASSAGSRRSQASTDFLASSAVSSIEKKPLIKKGLFDDDDALFGVSQNDPAVDIFSGPVNNRDQAPQEPPPPDLVPPPASVDLVEENSVNQSTSTKQLVPPITGDKNRVPSTTSDKNNIASQLSKPTKILDDLFGEDGDDDLFRNKFAVQLTKKPSVAAKPPSSNDLLSSAPSQRSPTIVADEGNLNAKHSKGSSLDRPIISNKSENNVKSKDIESLNSSRNGSRSNSTTTVDSTASESKSKVIPDAGSKNLKEEKQRKPQPPKTLNIRKETDPSLNLITSDEDDGDLFCEVTAGEGLKAKNATCEESSTVAPKSLVVSDRSRPMIVPSQQVPSSETKDGVVSVSEVDGGALSRTRPEENLKVGGMKRMLNIDPRALLPGAKPVIKKTPDTSGESVDTAATPVTPVDPSPSEREPVGGKKDIEKKTAGFDQPVSFGSALTFAQKDRAKLGVKRRPPSSKNRREAARLSQNLDFSDSDSLTVNSPLSPDAYVSSVTAQNASKTSLTPGSNLLSPSTDEDDLFGVPQDLPPEYGTQQVPSADIFAGAPVLSPIASFPVKDDLFSSSKFENREEEPILPGKEEAAVFSSGKPVLLSSTNKSQVNPLPEHSGSSSNNKSEPGSVKSVDATDFPSVPPPISRDMSVSNLSPKLESNSQPQEDDLKHDIGSKPKEYKDLNEDNAVSFSAADGGVPKTNALVDPVDVDPLNKTDPTSKDEDLLSEEKDVSNAHDDHSSLFAFVKKKNAASDQGNKPLFSKTPSLPTMDDNTLPKPRTDILDEDESDDLFTSMRTASVQKTVNQSISSKNTEGRMWRLSDDDDDDDLFSSGIKPPVPPISANVNNISSPASTSLTKDVVEDKQLTSSSVSQTVVKSKPAVKEGGLFGGDDSDEDSDLFSKQSFLHKNSLKSRPGASSKTSFFDDDDDDLFGSTSSSQQGAQCRIEGSASKSKVDKTLDLPGAAISSTPKSNLQKGAAFNDPLMALPKDD